MTVVLLQFLDVPHTTLREVAKIEWSETAVLALLFFGEITLHSQASFANGKTTSGIQERTEDIIFPCDPRKLQF